MSQNLHINSYELERLKDNYLNEIKYLCFMFLENKKNIKQIENTKILECYNFVVNEYEIIAELKKGIKVKTYYSPYTEIYSNLDNLIAKSNLLSSDDKMTFIELTKDINYLEDTLAFCCGILGMIIAQRKI